MTIVFHVFLMMGEGDGDGEKVKNKKKNTKRKEGKNNANELDKRLGGVDLGDCAALDSVEESTEHDTIPKKSLERRAPVLEPFVARDLQQKRTRMLFVYCVFVVRVICSSKKCCFSSASRQGREMMKDGIQTVAAARHSFACATSKARVPGKKGERKKKKKKGKSTTTCSVSPSHTQKTALFFTFFL